MKKILFVLVTGILFYSCGKGPCDESSNVNSSSLVISFIDKQSGKYLYTETNPLYNIDSLKIYDEFGSSLPLLFASTPISGTNSRYFSVSVSPIYNQQK